MGPFVAQGLAALIANLTMVGAGMIFGWSSPSLPKLLDPDDEDDLKLTTDEGSWAVSITSFGSIFGPIMLNSLVDRIGRKWSLNLIVLPMLVAWLIMGLTASVVALYVGRFISGLGVGACFALLPIYLGEIAEDSIRGALGTLMTTSFTAGMLLSYSIGPWISLRMLCVASAVPPLLLLGLSPWIPETPHFLLIKGESEKARASLAWLRGRKDVDEEIAALERNVIEEQKLREEFGVAELFRSRVHRRALGITFGLLLVQQLSGVIAILSYGSLIFESSGLTGWNELSVIIMGVVEVIAGISVIFVVDSAGRRPILILSAILTSLSLTCEAVFFHLKTMGYDTGSFSWTPLLGIVIFYFTFTPGLGSIPYAMIGELFPTNVKAPATMLLSVYGSAMGVIVSKVYQVTGEAIGIHWVFYFFAATTLAGAVFVYVSVPETKKLSLQDIQENLNSGTIGSKNAPSNRTDATAQQDVNDNEKNCCCLTSVCRAGERIRGSKFLVGSEESHKSLYDSPCSVRLSVGLQYTFCSSPLITSRYRHLSTVENSETRRTVTANISQDIKDTGPFYRIVGETGDKSNTGQLRNVTSGCAT